MGLATHTSEGRARERLARRLSAATYGTILVLASLSAIDTDQVESGLGWELVSGVGLATWIAHVYAETMGDHLRHGALRRHEVTGAMVDGLPIPLAALPPAIVLLLGRIDVLEPRAAMWIAVVVAVLQLAAVGVIVGRVATGRGTWRYAAATASLGVAVVVVKLALSH